MSVIGVVWVVLLILKFVGVIAVGWLWLIFWPIVLIAVLMVICFIFAGSAGFLINRFNK